MKIGVIGSGNMGRHIGLVWAERAHEVFFGSRKVAKAHDAAALSAHAVHAGTNDEAARFGDVLLYTVRDADPRDLVSDASAYDGKVVIDTNNHDVPDGLDYPAFDVSIAEQLQAKIPSARVVKAFNTTATELFELCPDRIKEHEVSVFIAGDDEAARAIVAQLVTDIGMVPVDLGPLYAAKTIERAAQLTISAIIGSGHFHTAMSIRQLPVPEGEPRLGGRQMSGQMQEDLRSLDVA
jgi:8-hydroxy-5-deazaflavin:NADPH oxidoreductase